MVQHRCLFFGQPKWHNQIIQSCSKTLWKCHLSLPTSSHLSASTMKMQMKAAWKWQDPFAWSSASNYLIMLLWPLKEQTPGSKWTLLRCQPTPHRKIPKLIISPSARGGRDDPRYVIVRQSGRPHSAETLGQEIGAKKESETGGATTHEGAMLKLRLRNVQNFRSLSPARLVN